jgi:flagellar hook-associated protein 3 FlgL
MTGRITQLMVSRSTLADLQDDMNRLSTTQRKLSSGKEITQPSDNPYGTTLALQYQGELDGLGQYSDNVADATAWQNASEASLSKVSDAVQRARELLVQGGSDAAGPQARAAAAAEIDQLIESVKQEGNASYAGRYIFAGTATATKPYQSGATDTYGGNAATIAREIGKGVTIPVNTDISPLLGNGQAAADGKLLNVLRDISQHLKGSTVADGNSLRTTDLQGLDANLDVLNQMRAQVGATTNRLTTASSRLTELQENTTKLLSNTQDADMAKTMIDYSTQQNVYQAALRAGGNIVQSSLLDFLR